MKRAYPLQTLPGWQRGMTVPSAQNRSITDEFFRGSLTTGILAALQQPRGKVQLDRRTLRLALQGGAALAAGTAAVQAARQARHGQVALALVAGAAAVAAAEYFLKTDDPVSPTAQDESTEIPGEL